MGRVATQKVLYLATEDWYFWSHRMRLAEAAKKQGYEIIVVAPAGDYADRITSKGFILLPFTLHRSLDSPFRELATIIRLARLYKRVKPDLVHHIALKPVISGSIAAWLAGVPHVINAYTGLGYLFTNRSLRSRFFKSIIVPLMAVLLRGRRFHSIVQNNDDKQLLLKRGLVRSDYVSLIRGSGVDTSVFQFSAEPVSDTPVVLFASRLLKDKGITEFIRAVELLKARGAVARFVVVGKRDEANPTGITRTELEDWVERGIIEYRGHREDMHEVFSQVHIVCLPSYREGLPKVLLEAAACGRPIVTTDAPGCRDVVIDGINGFLVPVKDPVRLAEAIQRLLDSADLRRQMGEAGRKRVLENFSMERVNSETVEVYDRLMSARVQ